MAKLFLSFVVAFSEVFFHAQGMVPSTTFSGGTVEQKDIKASLKDSLEAALGFEKDQDHLRSVEKVMYRTFQASPKSQARLGPKAVRHLLQRYFSKVHGWTLGAASAPEAEGILQSGVPALMQAAVEARQFGRGLSMSEVVALAVALERLAMEGSANLKQDQAAAMKAHGEQCVSMRSALEQLDVSGTGRVSLQDFRALGGSFSETEDELRASGSLDESISGKLSLRLANYMSSAGNCGKHTGFYSVCCVNSCDLMLEELEGKVQGPTVDADRLFTLIGNLSLTSLGENLRSRLLAISERSGDQVHLHGRHFAQWMHFAFPRQCPHPVQVPSGRVADQKYMDLVKAVAPDEWEVQISPVTQWEEEDDSLLLFTDAMPAKGPVKSASYMGALAQLGAVLALSLIAWRTARDGFRASVSACGLATDKPKGKIA